ncbi:TetR/AcrR family transcriptional regulator [Erythrobacter sp.]|uniref:TetR/AcrR family transcriptional regulator n=1 Tax=Erythrobacter sp. TaxID=1042 RepID=UPI001B08D9D3|nr:TetR/AcrR family transcriptional regulator [Erythrobacter sp.]MBO6526646.1 TetR/AcrR family transcriptional regulator [Erythrobacter sp.]MBO6529144.1 TetR/AcrR family transcriptional regulator [Erythrobacter sp.]MBO6767653.1 TetR/AcrR family transcriptional regulator [Erythrobacter sp.]
MSSPASQRLTEAASRLFQAKGLSSVGINEVVREAGVAKMSLYNNFPSKSDLAKAAYAQLSKERQQAIEALVKKVADPETAILEMFDLACRLAARPGFRGCAFIDLAAHSAQDVGLRNLVRDHKRAIHRHFEESARRHGAARPRQLATQLLALWDGALTDAAIEGSLEPIHAAREAAHVLLAASK